MSSLPLTMTPSVALEGDLDVEAVAKTTGPSYSVKGVFFERLRGRLGSAWETLAGELDQPPRLGRYMPFRDYPHADYTRLAAAAAQRAFPSIPLREAVRRLARDDFELFGGTTLGRIVLSAVGDAKSALLAMGSVYTRMAPGDWKVTSKAAGPQTVTADFERHGGSWEYQLGQTEGVVMHYGATPRITISRPRPGDLRFEIEVG